MKFGSAISLVIFFGLQLAASELSADRGSLITHEWGTFTSIAREDGSPARWAPLAGPADVPCFVNNLGPATFKERAAGLVRMETPVLYFYAPRPVTLSVNVRFPQGWVTEWYPSATKVAPASAGVVAPSRYAGGAIQWDRVEVLPGEKPTLPVSRGSSHYYTARETDAAPLRIGGQWEKLLFYRGVGDFEVPLRPIFTSDGNLQINNTGSDPVPLAILFENRSGRIGYRVARSLRESTQIKTPALDKNLEVLRQELAGELTEFGLYRKEAAAMIETWRDSWFEEGMRLFYIVPRATLDNLLPLDITPAPVSSARVFVGRIELLSPATRAIIETASTSNDVIRLAKMGRFLGPWITQMERENPGYLRSAAVQSLFRQPQIGPGCVQ